MGQLCPVVKKQQNKVVKQYAMIENMYFYQLWRLKMEYKNANKRDVDKDKILKFYINGRNSTMYNNV
jgi:hypothetical protein